MARNSEMSIARISSKSLALSTADQVVSSASNFLILILLATVLSVTDFARTSTIWTVISFTVIIQRSVFGVPLLLDLDNQKTNLNKVSGARLGSLILGAPAVLVAVAFFVEKNNSVYLFLACSIPLILLQDLGRYVAISKGRAMKALTSDLILLLPISIAIGLKISNQNELRANVAVGAFGFGLIGATLVVFGTKIFDFSPKKLRDLLKEDMQRRKMLFIDSALISGTAIGSLSLVWICYGPSGVAAFNGSLTALAPIGLSTLVIQLVVQHGLVGSFGIVRFRETGIFILLVMLGTSWIAILVAAPPSIGTLFLGDSWVLSEALFKAMGFSLIAGMILEFLIVALRAQGSFDQVLTLRKLAISALPLAYFGALSIGFELEYALIALGLWGLVLSVLALLFLKPFSSSSIPVDKSLK
jgi:hypothetical protein